MDILTAMEKCEIGGHVSRKAYPWNMYFKNEEGIFPEVITVGHDDFVSQDWENHAPTDSISCSY